MKKRCSKVNEAFLVFVFTILIGFNACQEPIEGCLDVEAVNFNAATDVACCCCCEYPSVSLALDYRAGASTFNLNTPFEMSNGDTVIFTRAAFYVSNLTFYQDNEPLTPFDTIVIYEEVGEVLDSSLLLGNVGLINRRGFSINMGRFEKSGLFDAVSLKLGLIAEMNKQPIDRIPNQNRLAIQADSMHTFTDDGGYIFLKFDLDFPESNTSRQIIITKADMSPTIEQSVQLLSVTGFNKTINMSIDYLAWIDGIDFENDSDSNIRQKIVNNTESAWLFSTE